MGKNKNKTDGGLTTLNGLSESNTLAKLTVKVTDEHCSKKRQLKLQRNTNKALKPPAKSIVWGRAGGACASVRADQRRYRACISCCQKRWTHVSW